MEPFIAQIQIFGFNYEARGWAFCNGQLMPIAQNSALFALIGTTFGGNGTTVFGLPDLRGRIPIHPGQGPGLSPISWGEIGGSERETLTTANIPSHSHTLSVSASGSDASLDEPQQGARLGVTSSAIYVANAPGAVALAADTTSAVGGNQPFSLRNPYVGIYYSIALQGIFPPRN